MSRIHGGSLDSEGWVGGYTFAIRESAWRVIEWASFGFFVVFSVIDTTLRAEIGLGVHRTGVVHLKGEWIGLIEDLDLDYWTLDMHAPSNALSSTIVSYNAVCVMSWVSYCSDRFPYTSGEEQPLPLPAIVPSFAVGTDITAAAAAAYPWSSTFLACGAIPAVTVSRSGD